MAAGDTSIEVRFSEALITHEQALEHFGHLTDVDRESLRKMLNWLQEGRLTLSTEDNQASLGEALAGEKAGTSQRLVRAYFTLESLRRALDWTAEAFVDYLLELQQEQGINEKGAQLSAGDNRELVLEMFSPPTQVDLLYKARRIYDGALPSYAESFTTVDLRPVFSEGLAIKHGLITATLEIVVRKPDETARSEKIAVQVDMADITEMEKTLSRAREKILEMRRKFEKQQGIKLFNPCVGLEEGAQQ